MFRLAIILVLSEAALGQTQSQTSLCCCGCTTEQCPQVGPTCASPTQKCSLPSDLRCSDLQRLWDENHEKGRAPQNTDQKLFLPPAAAPQLPISVDISRIDSDQPVVVHERGERGGSTWSETVVPKANDGRPTFEKLEVMVVELQDMLKKVKQDVLEQKAIKQLETTTPNENVTGKEVDSSVQISGEAASLPALPRTIRLRRESENAADDSNFVETGNCNDPKLKKLIVKHIQEDAQKSKRAIQKAAEDEFGGTFNVICSPCEFSFLISSQRYCDGMKEQIACFAFLQPPTTRKL
ncbi:hypothetical protein Q1695_003801 [Nippostrongylus brasiliensis]|nr:hypothetical protein Q1695_003801 [Nippostrongylus brasiliensis]